MSEPAPDPLRAAEEAVMRLVTECRKPGPLYARSPRSVAQVSRNSKWLLNALAVLRRDLAAAGVTDPGPEPAA